MKIQRYGWRPDRADHRDVQFYRPAGIRIPAMVDWSAKLPPCYNQGDLGSCTANALAGALQFLKTIKPEPIIMPSRLFIYYNERVMEDSVDTDSGAEIRDGIKSINRLGVCPESEWPYDISKFADRPPAKCYADAPQDLLLQYSRVDNTHLNAVLAALTIGPVVGGFLVYESFESDEVAKTGIVPMPARGEQVVGGHAILVTGYDKIAARFKVRNSWGTDWGMKGYFTIPFDFFTNSRLASDFWLCRKIA
jgi:C1A family cysteine protease